VFVAFFIEKLGRRGAFNLSTAGWIPCGMLLLGTGTETYGMHRLIFHCRFLPGVVCRLWVVLCFLHPTACFPAACTLAKDEAAMQHRLRKVLSSYTFSSSALYQLDEDEEVHEDLRFQQQCSGRLTLQAVAAPAAAASSQVGEKQQQQQQ